MTYLLDERHIHPDMVVDGGLTIAGVSSRSNNVLVSTHSAVGPIIKQGRRDPVQPHVGWTGSGSPVVR